MVEVEAILNGLFESMCLYSINFRLVFYVINFL